MPDPAPGWGIDLSFRASMDALREVCRRRLGVEPGAIAVLHTSSIASSPAGGLSPEDDRWISSRPGFLVPVRALSLVFRGKLLQLWGQALARPTLRRDCAAHRLLRQAAATPWVVYTKAPMAGPEQVLQYLGRYTHRIAIGNERIVSTTAGSAAFRYRDRRRGNRRSEMRLSGTEFSRRFLQHVLPRRFVRVRHYGLLANAARRSALAAARAKLNAPPPPVTQEPWPILLRRLTGIDPSICPRCQAGTLPVVALLPPQVPNRGRDP